MRLRSSRITTGTPWNAISSEVPRAGRGADRSCRPSSDSARPSVPRPLSKTADTGLGGRLARISRLRSRRRPFSHRAADPFARFKGRAFVRLADALNVPRSFLTPFRDGLVTAASIPNDFVRRLAEAMDAVRRVGSRVFRSPAAGGPWRGHSNLTEKPSHQGQKTFRELVESTEMTDEQRQLLLQDCNDDGLL